MTAQPDDGWRPDGRQQRRRLHLHQQNSLSLGIVTTISDIGRVDVSVPDMVERMKAHPAIAPFLKGGKLKEYSAHLVTEGGLKMMPERVRDGGLAAPGPGR